MFAPTSPGARRVVSIGGGTGQPALIGALRALARPLVLTAVVAMADDGRSSGILREREHMLPPGDLRKCMVALAADPTGPLSRALEHRFAYLDNHALGNLLIAAMADETGDFMGTIETVEDLLGCVGRTLPSTLDPVTIAGETRSGERVRGQANLSYGSGPLRRVWLEPAAPAAFEPAAAAIRDADLVVIGPGSLFTSLMPNLLVPGIAAALAETRARRVFVCPKANVPGETEGAAAEDYLDSLDEAGFLGLIDVALIHRRDETSRPGFLSRDPRAALFPDVELSEEAERRLAGRVPGLLVRDMADEADCTAHDLRRLAAALGEVIDGCPSARR
ncbi:MAG: gluconeogenesis factor YvcK family protein [Collinsella sp.]|nr:gluconeogenesis factor YvcK family protein [Collinsella sp.]